MFRGMCLSLQLTKMTAKSEPHPEFWGAYLTLKLCIIYVSLVLEVVPKLCKMLFKQHLTAYCLVLTL